MKRPLLFLVLIYALLVAGADSFAARMITLDDAIDMTLNKTARGTMIRSNLEVAEQNYFAKRINFYLPEISINGSLPAYSVDESYRFFGGATEKRLYETRDLNFNSFIELNQSILWTGGDVTATANLTARDDRYPNTRPTATPGDFISEQTRRGFFTFSYRQPLLKPSEPKYELSNTKDDFEIAQFTKLEEATSLKTEVVEAYVGLLQQDLKASIEENKFRSASLKTGIDSVKFTDGVISEEDWLISKSERLDAELNMFQAQAEAEQKERTLRTLLEIESGVEIQLDAPEVESNIPQSETRRMLQIWEQSIPVRKAEIEFRKAERSAGYQKSGHGLSGDLEANYSTGQGTVETEGVEEDIDTKGWEVALNFSFPLWDGGSAGADIKAAQIEAERARLELEEQKRNTEAEITNLITQMDVSFRRLEIVGKQIDLAQTRLEIAESRYEDGQISDIELIERRVAFLEARDNYLEELKAYLLNRFNLEGKFSGI